MKPSIEYLHECFRYEGGILYWKYRPLHHFKDIRSFNKWNTRYAYTEAGHINYNKKYVYCQITVNKILIDRPIIIWAMHNNKWPTKLIDHEDRNTLNDKIDNLREATKRQNSINCKTYSNNTSGYKGVSYYKINKKWGAYICNKYNRIIFLGLFNSPEEANEARLKKVKEYYGEFSNNQ